MASISLKYKSKQGNLTAPGDVDPGAMIPIATVTVGSGGSSSITFSDIPQNYEHLQIRILGRSNRSFAGNAVDTIGVLLNGSVYASINHSVYGADNTAYAGTGLGIGFVTSATAASNVFGACIIDILDYANTNKNKTLRGLSGIDNNFTSSLTGFVGLSSGLHATTNAITTVNLYPINGTAFVQYSSFALYGIKRAGA